MVEDLFDEEYYDDGVILYGFPPTVEPEQETLIEAMELQEAIRVAIEFLSERERYVILNRFGLAEELTQQEIADRLGITRSRVFQIENHALRLLRHPSVARPLQTFVQPNYVWRRSVYDSSFVLCKVTSDGICEIEATRKYKLEPPPCPKVDWP